MIKVLPRFHLKSQDICAHLYFNRHNLTCHQYYLQLRKDLLEERVHCDDEAALLLASLALQAEYGDYQPEVGLLFLCQMKEVLVNLFLFYLFCFALLSFPAGDQNQGIPDKHFPQSYIFCLYPVLSKIMADLMMILNSSGSSKCLGSPHIDLSHTWALVFPFKIVLFWRLGLGSSSSSIPMF